MSTSMSSLSSRKLLSSPQSGMSADQWLQSRKAGNLNKGTVKKPKKYSFLDDTSSDESLSASFFIKKDAKSELKGNNVKGANSEDTSRRLKESRPKTSRGSAEPLNFQKLQGNTVLDRFAQLEKQIRSRQGDMTTVVMSSSDMDFELSSDSEAKKHVNNLKKATPGFAEEPDKGKDSSKSHSILNKVDVSNKTKVVEQKPQPAGDEQNIAKKKSVSFATHLVHSLSSNSDISLDDFMPYHHSDDEVSLDDVLPATKLHTVLSLDDLMPIKDEAKEDNGMTGLLVHSIEDLVPALENDTKTDSLSSAKSNSQMFNIHSIDELLQDVPEDPLLQKKTHSFSSPSNEINQNERLVEKEEVSPHESEIKEYSSDFNSDSDDTLRDTDSIAEELSQDSVTISRTESSMHSKVSKVESSVVEASYTDSFESVSTSKSSRSKSPSPIPDKELCQEAEVQTEPVKIFSLDDPTPGFMSSSSNKMFFSPSPIITNEAVAVLTSYSPGILAMHEMLKQQLQLTRNFVERSERLHKNAMESLTANYQYASIQEARQLINLRRKKLLLPAKYPNAKTT